MQPSLALAPAGLAWRDWQRSTIYKKGNGSPVYAWHALDLPHDGWKEMQWLAAGLGNRLYHNNYDWLACKFRTRCRS